MKYRSGLDGLVCMTRQSFVMWNPCVRVTHLMLTLKVWPSHAWLHMCEARRLRCDTHTQAGLHTQYSALICLPHPTYSRSTPSNYCVFVRKSRTRQAKSASGAVKHKSGASGPSPSHLTNTLTSSPFLALIWITLFLNTTKAPWVFMKEQLYCVSACNLMVSQFKHLTVINPIKLLTQLKYYFHHY